MITVSVSGRSDGLVASSNINMFLLTEGTIGRLLSERLSRLPEIELPFEVLTFFVEAKSHTAPQRPNQEGKGIRVRSQKELMRFKTGQLQKVFELVIDNGNFYQLTRERKQGAIANAFETIAAKIAKEFPSQSGIMLSNEITLAARDYLGLEPTAPPA